MLRAPWAPGQARPVRWTAGAFAGLGLRSIGARKLKFLGRLGKPVPGWTWTSWPEAGCVLIVCSNMLSLSCRSATSIMFLPAM